MRVQETTDFETVYLGEIGGALLLDGSGMVAIDVGTGAGPKTLAMRPEVARHLMQAIQEVL